MQDPKGPCPKCGKIASDLRTTDAPGSPDVPRADVALPHIPDLVIPSPPTSKPSLPRAATPAAAPASSDPFDDELGAGDLQIDLSGAVAKPGIARPPTPGVGFNPFEDDLAGGPAIELDTTGGGLPPRASHPGFAAVAPPSAPVSSPRSLAPNVPQPPQSLAPRAPEVDAFDARAYADYGPPPEAFWRAPLYAYRVFARRGALRRDLPAMRDDTERTHKRVHDALAQFGERARERAVGGPLLDRVKEAEALLKTREGAQTSTTDAHAGALAAIDARLAIASAELARTRDDEARAQTTRDAAEEDQRRADAKIKRVDIEIRNQAATAPSRAEEREALARDLAQKIQKRTDAEAALATAKREATAAQAKNDAVVAERTAEEARYARQSGVRGEGSSDAQKRFRAALVDLGRAMLTDASATDLAAARDELARLEAQATQKAKALRVHESAIDAYDKGKVMLGLAVIFAAFLIVLGVLFFPFLYRAFAA
jgi:hypothetical protein